MGLPLYKQLCKHILEEIKSGRLQKGERVPSELELAEKFGVSRITSKKAFEILAQAKIIERSRGKGSFVSHVLPELSRLDSVLSEEDSTVSPAVNAADEQRLIGLVLPHFAEAYGLRFVQSMEEHCSLNQCHLVLKRTYGRQNEEEEAIRSLVELGVDGLIVIPVHGEHYNAELLRLVLQGFPLVFADRYLKGIDAYAVYTDNKRAAQELTELLIDRGHKHIALLSPPIANTSTLEERFHGFSAAFANRNAMMNAEYCLTGLLSTLPSSVTNEKAMADQERLDLFIRQHPQITAFVACEYSLAVLLYRRLTALGRSVPDDCAVVCFDSVKDPLSLPLFTHIQQNERTIGKIAVEKLMLQIEGGENDKSKHTVVDFQLVEGRSTRA